MVGSDEKGNLTTSLHGKVVVPDGGKKNQAQTKKDVGNMEVILNGGERTTMTTISGDFAFYEVPAGVYALDVNDIEYTFSQLKIKVFNEMENCVGNCLHYHLPSPPIVPMALRAR